MGFFFSCARLKINNFSARTGIIRPSKSGESKTRAFSAQTARPKKEIQFSRKPQNVRTETRNIRFPPSSLDSRFLPRFLIWRDAVLSGRRRPTDGFQKQSLRRVSSPQKRENVSKERKKSEREERERERERRGLEGRRGKRFGGFTN